MEDPKKNIEALQYCLNLIEKQLDWGKSKNWRHSDFVDLSELIFNKTSIRISYSTLKRVWGKVSFIHFPKNTTLDALSAFLGFLNWKEFIRVNKESLETKNHSISSSKYSFATLLKRKNLRIPIAIIILTFILLKIMNIYHVHLDKIKNEALNSIEFYSDKPAEYTPYITKINYHIPMSLFEKNEFYIQAFDPVKKTNIRENTGYLLTNLLHPGVKKISLFINDTAIRTIFLYGYHERWVGCIKKNYPRKFTLYFPSDSIFQEDKIGFSQQLFQSNTDASFLTSVNYLLCRNFQVDGDNMAFEMKFRYVKTTDIEICQQTYVSVLADSSYISIPIVNPLCLTNSILYTSEKTVSSKNSERLNGFTYRNDDWHTLYVKVANKEITISLNNQEIYNDNYMNPLGNIREIKLYFRGNGEIQQFYLWDKFGNIVYQNSFPN